MRRGLTFLALLLPFAAAPASTTVASQSPNQPVVVHEWGTFTSIAGPDGRAERWQPLDAPQDLPCFVERADLCIKCSVPGTIRMETPVIYFYGAEGTRISVKVGYRQGLVSEWYPKASVTPRAVVNAGALLGSFDFSSSISWPSVVLASPAESAFPTEHAPSHYYLARATDASPVVVNGQHEKFLFYRGIGGFQPPVSAVIERDGRIAVTMADAPLGDVILFENRGGNMAYEVRRVSGQRTTFEPVQLEGEAVPPTAELEEMLVASGLYPKEAKAMVDTWRESWFEEGTRIFYIAPEPMIDRTLPLTVTPAPAATVRTFVGRVELFTRATLNDVQEAFKASDRRTLLKYGRFLRPIAARILAPLSPSERRGPDAILSQLYSATWSLAPTCGQ